mmetsp:Transcript_4944/g.17867  ORF Transcript_4944/g.17867 Transcript_4944/m.17867 type:complete len:356 (+) Transcript_4944:4166-5233(+)
MLVPPLTARSSVPVAASALDAGVMRVVLSQALSSSAHLDGGQLAAVFAHDVRGARQAGVEAVQRAQDLQWLLRVGHRRVHQAGLEGTDLVLGVARAAVPGGGHDALVVVDAAVLDADPVPQATARRGDVAHALGLLGPGLGIPFLDVGRGAVAGLDVVHQLVPVVEHHLARVLALQRARQGTADGGRQQLLERVLRFGQAQRLGDAAVDHRRRVVHLLLDALAMLVALGGVHVGEDVARQRPHLHRMAAPARALDPAVFGALVELLDARARALELRALGRVVRLGHAVPGVQAPALVSVLVPAVGDELLHLLRVPRVDRQDFVPVAVEDGTTRQLVRAAVVVDLRIVAVVHDIGG